MSGHETRVRRAAQPPVRTYACLEERRTKPTDYEVTTTALLYYPSRGFEVQTPVGQHYVQHQTHGLLRGESWDSFEDPSHTTYTSYVAERRDQEAFLDRVLAAPPAPLARELEPLLGSISALRFPIHGLQMTAAYIGALAPSGRISVAAAFQAADELRRVQRLCQWLSRSGRSLSSLDALGRKLWQQAPEWQPLRRAVEQTLVTYDWGGALLALNGVIKPLFDRLCFAHLADVAREHRDEALEKTLRSLGDDGRWHASWFVALISHALAAHRDNRALIEQRLGELRAPSTEAVQALVGALGEVVGDADQRRLVALDLEATLLSHFAALQLDLGEGHHDVTG